VAAHNAEWLIGETAINQTAIPGNTETK